MSTYREPRWHWSPPGHYEPLRPWLVAQGSLSRRIKERCREFRVQRLREQLDRGPVYVREVILRADEEPVVVARSTTKRENLDGPWRAMRGLANRPLADILFRDPTIHRRTIEYARIDSRHGLWSLVERALGPSTPAQLGARRSTFTRGNRVLVVVEVFLPAILALD